MKQESAPKTEWTVSRYVHAAEIGWVTLWLALLALVIAGASVSFTTAGGPRSLWQLVFRFLT